jgi:hypothetical protein
VYGCYIQREIFAPLGVTGAMRRGAHSRAEEDERRDFPGFIERVRALTAKPTR